ncbi:MAG: hypothetical protein CUN55_13405 [Phototrophicales bacterium]|nr:MAG: hypothetical protein CUN55_13405 [Phototrophicales bacterium]
MRNYILTAIVALGIGVSLGLYLGWVQFPREYRESYLCQLDRRYQEEYTIMVARGYRQDGDIERALERLQPLLTNNTPACSESRNQIENIPLWVQTLTEKYISTSADRNTIEDLAILSAGFGRTTPLMNNFLPEETQP